ncbi:MAG: hypothetical protein M3522_08600 [Actinomycetota bacterium]|jgi:hypothetical protein|nr:hypothetical protein [Actinomycetota bacterium]
MSSKPVLRRLVLLGTPLALAVLMLFHPSPYSSVVEELTPIAGWWITIHTVQFVLFAFMGVAVWMLTDGLSGIAATVSRAAAVVFALFYDIGDAVAGISTGILARSATGLPAEEQAAIAGAVEILFRSPVKNLVFAVGINAWAVALIAAAVALFWAGAPRVPLFLLALPVFFMSFDHAFPFGSLTFGSFFVVALWIELARPKQAPDHGDFHPSTTPPLFEGER